MLLIPELQSLSNLAAQHDCSAKNIFTLAEQQHDYSATKIFTHHRWNIKL